VKTITREWAHASCIIYFFDTKVSEVMNSSKKNPAAFIPSKTSLQQAVDVMATNHWHRVGIINDKGTLVSVLSQTQVIQFLAGKTDWQIGPIAGKTLKELHFGIGDVISVPSDTSMIDAYIKMLDYSKTGIALVNKNNKIIGNISASDLRVIGTNK